MISAVDIGTSILDLEFSREGDQLAVGAVGVLVFIDTEIAMAPVCELVEANPDSVTAAEAYLPEDYGPTAC